MDKLEFISPALANPDVVTRDTGNRERPAVEGGREDGVAPMDPEQVEQAVERINENAQLVQRDLEFSVSDSSGRIIVTVRDSATDEVIRQIPPEKLMAVAESLEEVRGLLFEAEA